MPDLSVTTLQHLKEYRLPGLDLGNDVVYPNYTGYSLLNLPGGICRMLGVPSLNAAAPLANDLLAACGSGFRRVILLVLDGLGWEMLQRYWQQGLGQGLLDQMPGAVLSPLTSIVPSTTTAALTTLWTGASPAAHGIVGYEVWLREFGVVANMILHSPTTFAGDIGGLRRAGFQPETFLPVPVLGPHLLQHGVVPYAFMHAAISRSGLSEMHLRQANVHSFRNPGDLWVSLRELVNEKPDEKQYIYAYWGDLDELSHRYGPDNERVALEFDSFIRTFERAFLNHLSPAARQDTLLILTADHGQVVTPRQPRFDLRNHPEFNRMLHIQPTGENRMPFLYVRPGEVKAVQDYVAATWPEDFYLMTTQRALEVNLFGPGAHHPYLQDRLGDLILLARNAAYLWWADKENPLLGRHGAMTPAEMLVPFYALRL